MIIFSLVCVCVCACALDMFVPCLLCACACVCVFMCAEAPGQPSNLTVDSIGATWVVLCWQPPVMTGQPGIARYDILVRSIADNTINFTVYTTDNTTNLNVTSGLLPNTEYEFRVHAVAVRLDVVSQGQPSNVARGNTTVTGKLHNSIVYLNLLSELPLVQPPFRDKLLNKVVSGDFEVKMSDLRL